jgi:integrase/recombinase XerD
VQDYTITGEQLQAFRQRLVWEEKSPATIEKYLRDAAAFTAWLDGRAASKAAAGAWKAALLEAKLAPATINVKLAAVNRFLVFLGWPAFRVKPLRIQRRLFRDDSRELTRPEYLRLLETARTQGRERLALLLETICGTGIRVSEVRYVTVEAVYRGRAEISLKGKIRTILLPGKLCRKLLKYARKHKTVSGEIFLTRNGTSLSRRQIWTELKRLCKSAGVESAKVFPHNLRHLFATIFYRACKDIVRLADVLGHSSIETTRIYLTTSGAEHAQQLNRLGLIL